MIFQPPSSLIALGSGSALPHCPSRSGISYQKSRFDEYQGSRMKYCWDDEAHHFLSTWRTCCYSSRLLCDVAGARTPRSPACWYADSHIVKLNPFVSCVHHHHQRVARGAAYAVEPLGRAAETRPAQRSCPDAITLAHPHELNNSRDDHERAKGSRCASYPSELRLEL